MSSATACSRYARPAKAKHIPIATTSSDTIERKAREFQVKGAPVISVDTKKEQLVGDFHTNGKEWQPLGKPETVRTHDFIDRDLGKAIPYGVYDVTRNEGWVNLGIDQDTAEFAVESIRRWWWRMGRYAYPTPRNC